MQRLLHSSGYRLVAITLVIVLNLISSIVSPTLAASPASVAANTDTMRYNPIKSTAQEEIAGVTTVGAKGVSETTAQIMARQLQAGSSQTAHPVRKRLLPSQTKTQNPDSPLVSQYPSEAPNGNPAVTTQRQTSPLTVQSPTISFTGAVLADTGSYPPDTMGTVGLTQFVVAVNGRFRSFNKTTGVADGVLNVNPDVFFTPAETPPVTNNFTSDPKIRYDRLTNRWIIVMIDVPNGGAGNNRVMLAVTDATSAGIISSTTVWTYFYFQGDSTNFADYPTIGVDNNALYIGANMFTPNGNFVGTNGYVVNKSSILGVGPVQVTTFANLATATTAGIYTPQGVDNLDPTATVGYFIGGDVLSFGILNIRRVTNPGGSNPTISSNIVLTVPSTAAPITVPYLGNTQGTNGELDALDDRLFAATMRNGEIWTAHNIGLDSTGVASSNPDRDGSRWYQIGNVSTTPTLIQSGTVFDSASTNPRYYWIPTINVSGQGHAAIGFSSAGNADRPNAAFIGRLKTDALGTMQGPVVKYTNSTANYNPRFNRWGDYSYTSVDPEDDMTMWTIQEFVDATDSYGVRAVKLLAPPPATISTATPATVNGGQNSVNVTINGASVNGSGFFDPGTAFTKHISATVSGGVVVNSVTYISPTKITLNLSTVGAANGAKNVTITNPDGQTTTANNVLTVGTAPVCTSVVVTSLLDDGSCETLRAALTVANSSTVSKTVTFALSSPATITLTSSGGGGLTINSGVTIDGGACGSARITIDGSGITGDGLTLNGATLRNLKVKGFSGRQIVANGGHNVLSCVVSSRN